MIYDIGNELKKYIYFVANTSYKAKLKKLEKYELKDATDLILSHALSFINSTRYYDVYVLGVMGSGKTTLALQLANRYVESVGKENTFYFYISPNDFPDIAQLKTTLEDLGANNDKENVVLVFDDFSFVLGRTQEDQQFKNLLSRIRHIFNKKLHGDVTPKIFAIKVGHSLQSLPPLLRDAYSICLLSMNMNMLMDVKKYTNISDRLITLFQQLLSNKEITYSGKLIRLKENERGMIAIIGNKPYLCKFSRA